MSEDIKAVLSREVQEFHASIISHSDTSYDVTRLCSNFTVFESITEHSLTGTMTIVDSNGLLHTAPIIGQEIVYVSYKYKDKDVELIFRVNNIQDIKNVNDNTGVYVLMLISNHRYKSATNLFSRAYKGKNTEIIQKIHEDFITTVNVVSQGASSHQIVFPYTKPYAAIDSILTHTFAEDKTPLFLYECVNGGDIKLKSLGDMLSDSEPVELRNINMINTDSTAQAPRNLPTQNQNVFEQVLKRGYSTFENLKSGVYAAFVTSIDISGKVYSEDRFDYKEHAPMIGDIKDPISDAFKIEDKPVNEIFNSKQLYFEKDSLAYESEDVGNLYQVDDLSKAAMLSYKSRMNSQFVQIAADSNTNIEVGKMVMLNFRRMQPNIDGQEDVDPVNSGLYLCTAIKHQIRAGKYSIIVEAQRFGVNREADI